jgi:UDP-N-acetylglucosamine transferase subunit ALG13
VSAVDPVDPVGPTDAAGPAPRFVLVMVGTDHHPFDRLVEWVDDWAADRPDDGVRVLLQHGRTRAPRIVPGRDFMPRDELDALLAEAEVVVSHGGPSTIMESRRRGVVPIVVARTVRLGEHVDDHQQRFAAAMAARGLIRLAEDSETLHRLLDEAVAEPLLLDDGGEDGDTGESALRLGRLVEELMAGRRPPGSRGPRRRLAGFPRKMAG